MRGWVGDHEWYRLAGFSHAHRGLITGFVTTLLVLLGFAALWTNRRARLESHWLACVGSAYLFFAVAVLIRYLGESIRLQGMPVAHVAMDALGMSQSAAGVFALVLAADDLTAGWILPKIISLRYPGTTLVPLVIVAGLCGATVPWSVPVASLFAAAGTLLFGFALCWTIGLRRRPFLATLPILLVLLDITARLTQQFCPAAGTHTAVDWFVLSMSTVARIGFIWPIGYLVIRMLTDLLPRNSRAATGPTDVPQGDQLSRMLSATCAQFDADRVEVYCSLPGQKNPLTRRLIANRNDFMDVVGEPPRQASAAGRVFDAKDIKSVVRIRRKPTQTTVSAIADGLDTSFHSVLAVPICEGSSIIGSLAVAWQDPEPATSANVTVCRLQQMASLLAPAVQSYRELAALARCNEALGQIQLQALAPDRSDDSDTLGLSVFAQRIAEQVLDILELSEVDISIDIGFGKMVSVRAPATDLSDSMAKARKGHSFEQWAVDLVVGHFRIGSLALRLSQPRPRSLMVVSSPVRQAVALAVAAAIWEHRQKSLGETLARIHVQIIEADTFEAWFQSIESAALAAGLRWAVASPPIGAAEPFGKPEHVASVLAMLAIHATPLPGSAEKGVTRERRPKAVPLEPPGSPPRLRANGEGTRMLEVRLPNTGSRLWFGVERGHLDQELHAESPFRLFLERLAEMAAAGCTRLIARHELERVQFTLMHTHAVATIAAANKTVVHQIRNSISNLVLGTEHLNDEARSGNLTADAKLAMLIGNLHAGAMVLSGLCESLDSAMDSGDERPADLFKAVAQSQQVFAIALREESIDVTTEQLAPICGDALADLPYRVAMLAIANLVDNAREAIGRKGRIKITFRDVGPHIALDVSDDGPGIPHSIRDWVFDVGVTTKATSGGWGLFLVKRTMREHHGDVQLVQTGPDGTTFRLLFPKLTYATREGGFTCSSDQY